MNGREAEIIELIKKEVKPALGCTEPIAVALAVAKAVEILEERCTCRKDGWRMTEDFRIRVEVSGNILKNGMGVGIPGTGMVGLHIASALGAVCGKTGTSENPHGEDHAVFIGFAPRENPRIAISVFLENSGFGGTWAAPMASLLIEKYLTGKVKRTQLERQVREFTIYTVDAQGRVTGPPAH